MKLAKMRPYGRTCTVPTGAAAAAALCKDGVQKNTKRYIDPSKKHEAIASVATR